MYSSNGRRFLDWLLITSVFVAFTWFRQGAPPSAALIAAIVIAAAVLATWAPNRIVGATRFNVPRIVLFAGAIFGFLAASRALQLAGDSVSGGLPLGLAGIALLTFAAVMLRMLGWRAQIAPIPDGARRSASAAGL